MKKSKINKKILFASLAGVVTLASVAAVAASCNDSSKDNGKTNKDGNYISKLSLENFYAKPSGDDSSGYHRTYNSLYEDGARMLGLISYSHSGAIKDYFGSNSDKKDLSAVLIDDKFSGTVGKDRVASISYRVDQAAFLTGIAAAYYLNANQKTFATDGKLTWGGYVGQHFTSTSTFIQGFKFGVQWANEKLKNKKVKQAENNEEKEWINVEQVFATNYQSGDFSPTSDKAKAIVNQLVSNNVDLILPVAGPQIDYATTAAAESSKPIVVVGVDTEQELDDNTNKARISENNKSLANGKTIIFSIVKRVDLAIKAALENASKGAQLTNDINKDVYKLGTHTEASLDKSTYVDDTPLVELSNAGRVYLEQAAKLAGLKAITYAQIVNVIQNEELFKLLSTKGTATLETLATKTSDGWVLKDNEKNKPFSELQKLLGGEVYINESDKKLYPYSLTGSSYLEEDPKKRSASQEFKKYWDAATTPEVKEKLAKVVLGQNNAVLKDKSFSESAYNGLAAFYKSKKIIIPKI
ncbi:BMP family protein [Ureaplasma parvum]|uniref:BMP family protein n=1 Tax=Ureaplasma parvum TaxID=134821 RepID=UPI0026E9DE74|nr:BMP family protein [Ureaplasma parvum]